MLNVKQMFKELKRKFKPRKIYECEWTVGAGNFMVPDPTVVDHSDLRMFVKGKRTRVIVEILGPVGRVPPPNSISGVRT